MAKQIKYGEDASVEILYTPEDYLPAELFDYVNSTSLVIRVTVADTSVLLLADTTHASGRIIENTFGDYLRSDMVQLAHHGHGDGGTDVEFYKAIDAPYVLFPGRWNAPSPAEKWARDNAKEYFLNPENTTVIDLPYNGEKEKVKII